jgi:hypothetical protein
LDKLGKKDPSLNATPLILEASRVKMSVRVHELLVPLGIVGKHIVLVRNPLDFVFLVSKKNDSRAWVTSSGLRKSKGQIGTKSLVEIDDARSFSTVQLRVTLHGPDPSSRSAIG